MLCAERGGKRGKDKEKGHGSSLIPLLSLPPPRQGLPKEKGEKGKRSRLGKKGGGRVVKERTVRRLYKLMLLTPLTTAAL